MAKGILASIQKADPWLRLAVVVLLLVWNVFEGAKFQTEYPSGFVKLYPYPLWRIVLLVTLLLGATWCPSVGLMMAFALFFYILDMEVTLDKWVSSGRQQPAAVLPVV